MSLIAEILMVPEWTLSWLNRKYFTKKSTTVSKDNSRVTVRNLTPDEMIYLVD